MTQLYDTYGPFPLEGKKLDFRGRPSSDFWKEIEDLHPGLRTAVGVYIISVKSTDGLVLPWYVGMTQKGFEERLHRQGVTFMSIEKKSQGGTSELYFIARRTLKRDAFIKAGLRPGIRVLEARLIDTCLKRNPNLHNDRHVRSLQDTVVPGYMNDRGKRSPAATSLNALITGNKT